MVIAEIGFGSGWACGIKGSTLVRHGGRGRLPSFSRYRACRATISSPLRTAAPPAPGMGLSIDQPSPEASTSVVGQGCVRRGSSERKPKDSVQLLASWLRLAHPYSRRNSLRLAPIPPGTGGPSVTLSSASSVSDDGLPMERHATRDLLLAAPLRRVDP